MLFNSQSLVAMFSGDEDIFLEIKADFIRTYADLVEKVRIAVDKNDAEELHISAHTLKGVLSTFCADEVKELAFELECMGREKAIEGANKKVLVLQEKVYELIKELEKFDSSAMK